MSSRFGWGPIRRQLALAFGLTALIPMLAAIWLSQSMVRHATERLRVPEVSVRLDQSLGLYKELTAAVKGRMRAEARAFAADAEVRRAARAEDRAGLKARLDALRAERVDVVSLSATTAAGATVSVQRKQPVDDKRENVLEVEESLDAAGGSAPVELDVDIAEDDTAPASLRLRAVFAVDRARFDELEGMSRFVEAYQRLGGSSDESTYQAAFAALLGISLVAAVAVGFLLARGVSVRIERLAAATAKVARGDFSARVPTKGSDELTALARSFNRMVAEVESSRVRIEYLQRLGAWQEMARRLAHEIKNPLTPIQLAVQEVHRRCPDGDPTYRRLVDTTLEVVEDEVGTLRRLVSEFSEFARLPRAELAPSRLARVLEEQRERLAPGADRDSLSEASPPTVDLPVFDLLVDRSAESVEVLLDRQLFRRALLNLLSNAVQAFAASGQGSRVALTLSREADTVRLDVDDDGPGVDEELRATLFEPYVTGRAEGTGLGLAIVKKIVVEHGGSIALSVAPLGGARFRMEFPVLGSPQSRALAASAATEPAPESRT